MAYIATQEPADLLHRWVAEPIVVDGAVIRLTISIGCASIDEHRDADAIMSTAAGNMSQQDDDGSVVFESTSCGGPSLEQFESRS